MELLGLLYPLSVFVFIRVAIRCFAEWAERGSNMYMSGGVVAVAFAFDSGARLISTALFAPYRWLLPLVLFALLYVVFRVFRKTYAGMPAQVEASDH